MAIYRITFNRDFSDFESLDRIYDAETPQAHFRAHPEDSQCLLAEEREDGLYMVVYYKTATAIATHPWTRYSWIGEYDHWKNMNQEDWQKAVRKFICHR